MPDAATQFLTDLQAFGPWTWVLAGLVLMTFETFIPGVHFLWFGLAAVIVGGVCLASLGAGIELALAWQLVLFATVSVLSVFFVSRFASSCKVAGAEAGLNEGSAQYVGRIVIVEEAISGGRGRVRVGDTIWSAEGADAPMGAHVRITGARGIVLLVAEA